MALIFAIVAAVLLGGSDFWAARAARTAPSITVTRSVVAVSSVLAPVLVLFVDSSFIARDLINKVVTAACRSGHCSGSHRASPSASRSR